jgi:hypothetical protein
MLAQSGHEVHEEGIGVRFSAGADIFLFSTASGPSLGNIQPTGCSFSECKAARLRTSLTLTSAEVKNAWSYTYTSPYALMS